MKKLTAGIFTVLMGLVSVNAADAAVASQGYVDFKVGENTTAISELSGTVQANKAAADAVADRVTTAEGKITAAEGNITTLQGKVQAMEDGNLTIKDGAITETNLATELANKINAAQTEAQVGSAIDTKITALNLANTYDAKGAASTAESNAKTYADGLNTAMNTRVETAEGKISALEGAGYQNSTQVGDAIDAKITALKLAETYEALDNKTQSVNEASTEDQYPSAKAVYTAVSTLKNGAVKNNTDAIEAINNETTGILATAKSYTDTQDAATLASAKSYADGKADTAQAGAEATAASALSTAKTELEGKITAEETARTNADAAINSKIGAVAEGQTVVGMIEAVRTTAGNAQTAEQVGSAIDKKIDALKLSETYDAKGAANDALGEAKTYAVGKANAALTASVKYTDDYITSLGLQQIASVPVDCSNDTNYCTLTANANGFAWEVIARVEGETVEGRTAVTPAATTKPAAPAALTE